MKKLVYVLIIIVVVVALWLLLASTKPVVAPTGENQTSSVPATGSSNPAKSAYFDQRSNTSLGTYLTDAKGMTLYTFANDTAGAPTCAGACAAKWPAYGPDISATGTAPINLPMLPQNVGTVKGLNGLVQFTWKNMPLYYYFEDKVSGDTYGEGIGGVWYVVKL